MFTNVKTFVKFGFDMLKLSYANDFVKFFVRIIEALDFLLKRMLFWLNLSFNWELLNDFKPFIFCFCRADWTWIKINLLHHQWALVWMRWVRFRRLAVRLAPQLRSLPHRFWLQFCNRFRRLKKCNSKVPIGEIKWVIGITCSLHHQWIPKASTELRSCIEMPQV